MSERRRPVEGFPIAEALRLIRTRAGLTQTAASKRAGAPDFRTLSHWETRRKLPSLRLLTGYLGALGLDFHDLQDTLDQVVGESAGHLGAKLELFGMALNDLRQRVEQLEGQGAGDVDQEPAGAADV